MEFCSCDEAENVHANCALRCNPTRVERSQLLLSYAAFLSRILLRPFVALVGFDVSCWMYIHLMQQQLDAIAKKSIASVPAACSLSCTPAGLSIARGSD
jgi:hypothetical protein